MGGYYLRRPAAAEVVRVVAVALVELAICDAALRSVAMRRDTIACACCVVTPLLAGGDTCPD